jgi:hypothetical protein
MPVSWEERFNQSRIETYQRRGLGVDVPRDKARSALPEHHGDTGTPSTAGTDGSGEVGGKRLEELGKSKRLTSYKLSKQRTPLVIHL